jgi:DNA-binding response OmpR family regulator
MDRAALLPRIAVVADDLIWATRLTEGVRRAGGDPVQVRSAATLDAVLGGGGSAADGGAQGRVQGCIVDLTARGYDGVAAIQAAAGAGVPVLAVGQHDDAAARRAARAAGAARVHAYRTLFERGAAELGAWIRSLPGTEAPA